MTRHPTDPEAPWRMAAALAKLVAQEVLEEAEARAALAAAPAPGADPSGWRARREWRLRDAIADWRLARARVRHGLARDLAPLLAARAPRAALEAAADAADPRGALRAAERAAILRHMVAAALAGGPPRRAGGG